MIHKIVAQSSNKKLLQGFLLQNVASEKFNFVCMSVKRVCHAKRVWEFFSDGGNYRFTPSVT